MNILKNRYFKFLHIVDAKDLKFVISFVKMISKESNNFILDDHAFIVSNEKVFNGLKSINNNVFLDEETKNWFKTYNQSCEWFISHGAYSKRIGLLLSKKIKQKIVFRYWGGRRPIPKKQEGRLVYNLLVTIYSFIYSILYSHIYGHFAVIGIANIVDRIDLENFVNNVPMMRMSYSLENNHELITLKSNEKFKKNNKHSINVIIGHRSDPNEHHAKYINLLERKFGDKISIFIPLSYGDRDYANQIKAYVREKKYTNIVIVEKFMEFAQYLAFLKKMDIVLLDGETSSALANLGIHIRFRNKLYVSRTGVIKKALDFENIPHHYLENLESETYESFITADDDYELNNGELISSPYDIQVEEWHRVFTYLENK